MVQGQEEILKEVIENNEEGDPTLIVLSSGVSLRAKPVSPLLIQDLQKKYKPPRVPTFIDEETKRTHENPFDPDYLDEKERREMEFEEAVEKLLIAKGTELISVPDGIQKIDDTGWVEDIAFSTGLEVSDHPLLRYMAWVKYVAVQNASDLTKLLSKVGRSMGVTEQLVAEATEKFPGTEAQ